MVQHYSLEDPVALIRLTLAIFGFGFMGIIITCLTSKQGVQHCFSWRGTFELVLVALASDTLRWDLSQPGVQYPILARLIFSALALTLGILAYVRLFLRAP